MPYIPGVQDMSGQYRAQAISQVGDSIGKAIQQFSQNQMLTKQAMGDFAGALSANPELKDIIAKFAGGTEDVQTDPQAMQMLSPDVQKAIQKFQSGKVDMQSALVLSGLGRTYSAQKAQASEAKLRDAQAGQAAAMAKDLAAQQQMRDQQVNQQKRFLDTLDGVMQGKYGGAPAGAEELTNRDPDFSPATPMPTYRDAVVEAMRSGAVASPDKLPAVAKEIHDKLVSTWKNGTRVQGVVMGGESFDKEGQKIQKWYPVVVKNDGSIERFKEPVEVYASAQPPGRVLDPVTYKPVKAPPQQAAPVNTAATPTPNGAMPPVGPQNAANAAGMPATAPLSPASLKDIEDAQTDITTMMNQLKTVQTMKALNEEMKKKRIGGLSSLTGTALFNNTIEPMMGDTSGQLFDAEAAKFKAEVMSQAKNVRNVFEFKAITGNVPESSQTPRTRAALLAEKEEMIHERLLITQTAMKLIQQGIVPANAWDQATKMVLGEQPQREPVGKAPAKVESKLPPGWAIRQ